MMSEWERWLPPCRLRFLLMGLSQKAGAVTDNSMTVSYLTSFM